MTLSPLSLPLDSLFVILPPFNSVMLIDMFCIFLFSITETLGDRHYCMKSVAHVHSADKTGPIYAAG